MTKFIFKTFVLKIAQRLLLILEIKCIFMLLEACKNVLVSQLHHKINITMGNKINPVKKNLTDLKKDLRGFQKDDLNKFKGGKSKNRPKWNGCGSRDFTPQ